MLLTIALDGPVGAGKSSVADGVAQKLGILHLDTGAMYRAFAWKALQKGVALEDEAALEALTATDLPEVRLLYHALAGLQRERPSGIAFLAVLWFH